MSGFRYEALDAASGKTLKGVLEADNARLARQTLREQGLMVVEISEIVTDADKASGGSRRGGVSIAQLALMTRQLSTLLDAGLTIEQALNVVIEQSEAPREREVLAAVRSEILAGISLSNALGQHPKVFPDLYRTLVGAGEESGKLPEVMRRLAEYIESRHALRSKVMLAFIYPAIITAVSILVVTGLLTYVVPQVVNVFQNTHQQLPLLTRGLLAVSDAVRVGGLPFAVVLALAVFLFLRALKNEAVRLRFDRALLAMPLLGRMSRSIGTARLASTLAILVGSGVPMLNAMTAASGVVDNRALREAVKESTKQVREGLSLSRALAVSKLFPPVLIHLIASGEASGRLEHMLDRAAKQQSDELETRVATITGLMEPLLILLMGAVVLVIVLAILLPVFEMNQLIK
ncbi:general secretion pathway protein F [Chitinivorax tropicus]|uniref:General secretion pathway protein F n=1 Tax=Chitinivorax tropicus TaxID=714531 RepID=A0A840MLU7_9PROT|nr:type II secretion system inner membrane protein GspF [Chitinivorax tropicus]MBB5017877.1 general secretion pathway protein F [Chitinivorax tropicus]